MNIDWVQALPYFICAGVLIAVLWAYRCIARMLFQNRWSRWCAFLTLLNTFIVAVTIGTWHDGLILGALMMAVAFLLKLQRTHYYRWALLALIIMWAAALLNHAALIGVAPLLGLMFYLLPRWKLCRFCIAAKTLIIMGLIYMTSSPHEWTNAWHSPLNAIEAETALLQPFFDGNQYIRQEVPITLNASLLLVALLLMVTSAWFLFKQSHNTLRPTALAVIISGWLMLLPLFIIAPNPPMRDFVWPIATAIISALMIKQKPQKALPKAKQGGHKPKSWD